MADTIAPIALTYEELVELTGLRQRKRMTRWLEDRGWVFEPPRKRGETPIVSREYVVRRLSGQLEGPRRQRLRTDRM